MGNHDTVTHKQKPGYDYSCETGIHRVWGNKCVHVQHGSDEFSSFACWYLLACIYRSWRAAYLRKETDIYGKPFKHLFFSSSLRPVKYRTHSDPLISDLIDGTKCHLNACMLLLMLLDFLSAHQQKIWKVLRLNYLFYCLWIKEFCGFINSAKKKRHLFFNFSCKFLNIKRNGIMSPWTRHVQGGGGRWVLEHLPLFPLMPKVPFCQGNIY